MRERRPGTGRSVSPRAPTRSPEGRLQRSVTFHGSPRRGRRLPARASPAEHAAGPRAGRAPLLTVGELLDVWLAADHRWKPSTRVGYESNARHLRGRRSLAGQRVVAPTPLELVRRSFARWEAAGATTSVIGGPVPGPSVGHRLGLRRADHRPPPDPLDARPGPSRARRPLTSEELTGCWPTADTVWWRRSPTTDPGSAATWPNRTCCWFASPRTPAPAAASSPLCSSTTSTAGSCTSAAPRPPT